MTAQWVGLLRGVCCCPSELRSRVTATSLSRGFGTGFEPIVIGFSAPRCWETSHSQKKSRAYTWFLQHISDVMIPSASDFAACLLPGIVVEAEWRTQKRMCGLATASHSSIWAQGEGMWRSDVFLGKFLSLNAIPFASPRSGPVFGALYVIQRKIWVALSGLQVGYVPLVCRVFQNPQ